MTESKCRKRKGRATPWDGAARAFHPCPPAATAARPGMPANLGICLHGVYIFNPATCGPEDLQQFLWAGIRMLDKEVKARGLSDGEVRRILTGMFDVFHDTASVIWASLQQMKGKGQACLTPGQPPPAAPAAEQAPPTPPENKAVIDLRRAFLRKKHQVRAYREELDRDLQALVED